MTTPDVDGPSVPDEESLAFELLVVASVTGAVEQLVDATVGAILAAHAAASRTGALSAAVARALARAAALRLRAVVWPPMVPALRLRAAEARRLGEERAVRELPAPLARRVASARRPGALPEVPDIDAALATKLAEAARLASSLDMGKRAAVLAVAGRARQGVALAKGGARWAANEGINAGTARAARAAGLRLVWVAERNACLHCLAHAGWAVEPGEEFPAGLSFDPLAAKIPGVPWPPLHPNCRCQVRTYDGEPGPPGTRSRVDPASAIAREARRSVALQWSDHASHRAARRAAAELLRAGADLPATVQARARRALRAGTAPRRPR